MIFWKDLVQTGKCKYVVFGLEGKEEDKTPHLQGYIEFEAVKSFKQVKKLAPNEVHWEKRQGNQAQAIQYCKKEGDHYEMGEKTVRWCTTGQHWCVK